MSGWMFQGSKLDQEIPVLKSFKLALQMSCPSSHIISLGKPVAIWAFQITHFIQVGRFQCVESSMVITHTVPPDVSGPVVYIFVTFLILTTISLLQVRSVWFTSLVRNWRVALLISAVFYVSLISAIYFFLLVFA